MQRLEYDHYGGPEVVNLRPYSLPEPRPEEVLVRVVAASVNPMDWKLRSGAMKIVTGSKFPRGMGSDFSGIVEAVGPKVSEFKKGDAVLGSLPMKSAGAFATKVLAPQKFLVAKPESLSFQQATTLPIAAVTAWLALTRKAALRSGQKLLINGAMGAVGASRHCNCSQHRCRCFRPHRPGLSIGGAGPRTH